MEHSQFGLYRSKLYDASETYRPGMPEPANIIIYEPLNARQVARIEAVHQGFLFQHLVAVQMLLSQPDLGWESVRIEGDEDIEVRTPEKTIYVQVKKRTSVLIYSDIDSSLTQFEDIRGLHTSGVRSGTPELWILSNAAPGEDLAARTERSGWPDSVFVITAVLTNPPASGTPLPGTSIQDQFDRCRALAERIEHSTLRPETLVWKLAAWVQAVAAGSVPDHLITVASLHPLLEQLLIQIQHFPDPPAQYRPQAHEPPFDSTDHLRLLTGLSGAGKTAWAGEFGLHRGTEAVYFDCSDLPSAAIAASLVRELAVRFLRDPQQRSRILLPGVQGFQGLRLIDEYVARESLVPCLVLDNLQRIDVQDAINIVDCLPTFQIVFLSHPMPALRLIEGRFEVERRSFEGWSIETIAEEAREAGCFADPAACEELRRLTAGSPLFIRDVCKLAAQGFSGDVRLANEQITASLHERTTYQELVVGRVLERLETDVLTTIALLALSTVPLKRDIILEMAAGAQNVTPAKVASSLREAGGWSIVQSLPDARLEIHDAFRSALRTLLLNVAEPVVSSARERLLARLLGDLQGGGIDQYMLMAQLFFESGKIESLIDMATSSAELVREHGAEDAMRSLIEKAAASENLPAEDRFWAADSLAFWALADGHLDIAEKHMDVLAALIQSHSLTERARSAYIVKQLGMAAKKGHLKVLSKTIQRCKKMGLPPEAWRVALYTYAMGLFMCDQYERAAAIAQKLVVEYYELLDIEIADVYRKNLAEVAAALGDLIAKGDDIKHLADCLDLQAKSLLAAGRSSGLCRLHAHKFYLLAEAPSSSVKVGQDFVDECLRVRSDPEGARMFLEQTLLPVVKEKQLLSYLVPVTCQYAVVLAYCGEASAARQTLEDMARFMVPGTHGEAEYIEQCNLTEMILTHGLTLGDLNDLVE